MNLLFLLLLLFPGVAMASDKCLPDPGYCFAIGSAPEMEICKETPSTVALNSSSKESPDCKLPKQPAPQPPEFDSVPLQGDATFTDISGKAKSAR